MNFTLISKEVSKTLMETQQVEWAAKIMARQTSKHQQQQQMIGQQTMPGQAHVQVTAREIDEHKYYQDKYEEDIEDAIVCFLQGDQTSHALVAT